MVAYNTLNNQNIKTLNIMRTYSIMHNICFFFIFVIYSFIYEYERQDKLTVLSATNRNVIGEALTDVSSDV